MTHRPMVIALLLAASRLPAQTSVETGGGVARLDHYSGGAFSSFRGQAQQAFGPLKLTVNNVTAEHRGLGIFYRTTLGLKSSFSIRSLDITLGPEGALARGVEMPSAKSFGVGASVHRRLDHVDLVAGYTRGGAWFDTDRTTWSRLDASVTTRIGMLKISPTYRHLQINERVVRTEMPRPGEDATASPFLTRQRVIQIAGVSLGWRAGRLSFDGRFGGQFNSIGTNRTWWENNLAVRLATSLSLVVGHSSIATDPVLRMRGGTFTSLGLRIGLQPEERRLYADALAFEITSPAPGRYLLRFAIPGARRSATMSSDITGWKPVELTRLEDGRWEVELTGIKPGTYRVNVRADDGEWSVPPSLAIVDDGYGGVVGLFVLRP